MSRIRATIAVTYPADDPPPAGDAAGDARLYAEGDFSAEDLLITARRCGHQVDVTFQDVL